MRKLLEECVGFWLGAVREFGRGISIEKPAMFEGRREIRQMAG
jgi:hypothetical protein